MILKSLNLKNWGVFKKEKRIELIPGLNIIIGPNESGKSTVREAFIRIFFSKHNIPSSAQEYIPWGTSGLIPEIGIEFENGGKRYRASKRFIKDSDSNVEIFENEDWTGIAGSDKADNYLVSILEGTLPSRGPKLENMGIVKALWTPQGALGDVEDVGEAARGRLLAEVGGVITTDAEGKMMKILDCELDERLTRKTREPTKKSELFMVEMGIIKLKERFITVSEKAKIRENRAKELEDAENALNDTMLNIDEARKEVEQAEAAARNAKEHESVREAKDLEVKNLERQWQELNEQVIKIAKFVKTEGDQVNEEAKETPKRASLSEEIKIMNDKLDGTITELGIVEDDINKIENTCIDYRIAYDTLRRKDELNDLIITLKRVELLNGKACDLRKELETLGRITDKEIKAIIKKDEETNKLQAKLEAQGLDVTISLRKQIKGTIRLDNRKEMFSPKKGVPKKWKASRTVHLIIPEVLEIKVASGSIDVRELSSSMVALKKNLLADLAKYGAVNIDELRAIIEKRKLMVSNLEHLEEEIENRAIDGLAKLREKVTELTAEIASDKKRISEPSARDIVNKETIGPAIRECAEMIENIEETLEKAKDDKRKKKKKENNLRESISRLDDEYRALKDRSIERNAKLEFTRNELKNLRLDSINDGERIARMDSFAAQLDISRSALRGLEFEMLEKEKRPLKRLDRARNAFDELKNNITKSERKAGELRGSMEQLVSEGDYSEMGEIEALLAELEGKKSQFETEARAIELLFDLMEHHRVMAIADVVKPVSHLVDENLRRLIGLKYNGVKLDENLKPCGVKVDRLEECPDFERFSHGTREQIGTLVLLAVAEVMAKDERLPVLLEEPLAHTDGIRRHLALEIFQESAEHLQIIIFTCHPEHYAGLIGANRIELE